MEKFSETIMKFLKLDNLIDHITGYLEARMELLKAEIREEVALAIGKSVVIIALTLVGFLFLIFFSVGAAHFINRFFEAPYAGFWAVATFYGLTFLVLVGFRKNISRYFQNQLSTAPKKKEK